jgi:2-polyprenyl-3-methyl-5-hydroxy-6-metoxy-1,4-benzoquinol methylase
MGETLYKHYEKHYQRMFNEKPDWEYAEQNPDLFRSDKPWLPRDKTARILDFGCGWGHQLQSLWCAGYRNLEGVELVSAQADIANEMAKGRVKITCMDGREYLDNKHNVDDLIILNDVLEHISYEDTISLLKQLHSALVDGGTLVLRVINASSILSMYSRYLDITHKTLYTEYGLMQLLDQTGFIKHSFVSVHIISFLSKRWRHQFALLIRHTLNYCLHRFLYWLRGQKPIPTLFGMNIEVYSKKQNVLT